VHLDICPSSSPSGYLYSAHCSYGPLQYTPVPLIQRAHEDHMSICRSSRWDGIRTVVSKPSHSNLWPSINCEIHSTIFFMICSLRCRNKTFPSGWATYRDSPETWTIGRLTLVHSDFFLPNINIGNYPVWFLYIGAERYSPHRSR